ncbi:MAG TPA: DUF2461 domain-containing protein [Acidobacteriota bacterium]|nr:DUF2461 domain-containing protein [Acidobacteriota bacterium]
MSDFEGFPRRTLTFLRDLRQNNSKEWFDAHRPDYDDHLLAPARSFVEALGKRLVLIAPHVHADPRVNRSIFRIFRDTRFSKNKQPYKTHLALWFWEGRGKRMDCPGFYFHLEPERVMLGCGMYRFPKAALKSYRQALKDRRRAGELQSILEGLGEKGYSLGGKHYKRLPRGFTADHPQAELLLHNGLYSGHESKPSASLHKPAFVDDCFQHYHALLPLHRWLLETV